MCFLAGRAPRQLNPIPLMRSRVSNSMVHAFQLN